MSTTCRFKLSVALAGLLAGCGGDGDGDAGTDTEVPSTSGAATTMPTTVGSGTSPGTNTTGSAETTAGTLDTTAGTLDTTAGSTTSSASSSGGSTGADPFVFSETAFEDYVQVDRQGFPAVNSGLNLLGDKDAYNAASPVDDASLTFFSNILESLETLHIGAPAAQTPDNTGLDDDLLALGLLPCTTPPLPMDTCDDQAVPFALPDVIEIRLDAPAEFPNGRTLDFPVMDVILAVLLLDLGTHPVDAFVDLFQDGSFVSLNPLQNDVPFADAFPYLAPAH